MNKKLVLIISTSIIIIALLIVGVSYAYWGRTIIQDNQNVITSLCFKTTFRESSEALNLDRTYPMDFEESKTLTPYTFTIENNCTVDVKYYINLETLTGSTLNNYFLDYSLNNDITDNIKTRRDMDKTMDEAEYSKLLHVDVLKQNETKTYDLRLWINNKDNYTRFDTTTMKYITEDSQNKTWSGKVVVNSQPYLDTDTAILAKITSKLDKEVYQTIKHLEVTNEKPSNDIVTYALEDTINSDFPITGYMDGDTLKMYTEHGRVALNSNADNFSGLSGIEELEFSQFDSSKVTALDNSFSNMNGLKTIDLTAINMKNVKNIIRPFSNTNNIEEIINFENLDVSNVEIMFNIIPNLYNKEVLNLSNWNVSNLKDGQPFAESNSTFEKVIIDGWNLSNYGRSIGTPIIMGLKAKEISAKNVIINNNVAFQNNSYVNTLDVSNMDLSKCTKISYLFNNDSSLKEIIGIENLDVSNIEEMISIFQGTPITTLDLSNWNITKMTKLSLFANKIENLILDNLDFSNIMQDSLYFFSGYDSKIKYLSLKNTRIIKVDCISNSNSIETIDVTNLKILGNDISYMFSHCTNLNNIIGFNTMDISNVTLIDHMFYECKNIKTLDLTGMDISKTTSGFMIAYSSIETIIMDGLSFNNYSWRIFVGNNNNIKNVSMKNAIIYDYSDYQGDEYFGTSIETLDITNLDLSNATNLNYFFAGLSNLTEIIGLETIDTSSITGMTKTFMKLSSNVDISGISNWNVSNVAIFDYAFMYARVSITSDLLNNWNINKNASFNGMLSNANIVSYPNWDGTWNPAGTFTPNA